MNIPEEAIEKAAETLCDLHEDGLYKHYSDAVKAAYRRDARVALTAAWSAMESEELVTYYRSLTPDGKLWCESKNPEEVREMSEGMDCTFEFLRFYKVTCGWEEWK